MKNKQKIQPKRKKKKQETFKKKSMNENIQKIVQTKNLF